MEAEQARTIIQENIYCTIATATREGKPWISPIFFAYDEAFNMYWASNKASLHSELIRQNPRIAIVIFNSQAPEGEGDGVYMEATAQELSETDEVQKGIALFNARVTKEQFRIKSISEVTENGVWRLYKATPQKISKLSEGEYINGQYVDKRIDVSLS
jgi:nitroimidazol reductase NimA-like FMN-containing flavoprotein (pyridoxamine 5'-phosphate oxidase superfamily)